jgi:hypothetical protein
MSATIATETLNERRERDRLRQRSRLWLPTVDERQLDRLVTSAWVEALESEDGDLHQRAAAAVRRHGVLALTGARTNASSEAESRLAAIAMEDLPAEARRARSRRRVARPSVRVPSMRSAAVALAAILLAVWLLPHGGRGGDPPLLASREAAHMNGMLPQAPAPAPDAATELAADAAAQRRLFSQARAEATRRAQAELRSERRRARAAAQATARRRAASRARRAAPRPRRVAAPPAAPAATPPPTPVASAPVRPRPQNQPRRSGGGTWGSEFRP